MEKLIKDIEKILSGNVLLSKDSVGSERDLFRAYGRDDILSQLADVLNSYYERHRQASVTFGRVVSCEQWSRIYELVDDASLRWQLLPDDALNFKDLSVSDAYNLGYVASVLQMMRIFGIDEKLVKK